MPPKRAKSAISVVGKSPAEISQIPFEHRLAVARLRATLAKKELGIAPAPRSQKQQASAARLAEYGRNIQALVRQNYQKGSGAASHQAVVRAAGAAVKNTSYQKKPTKSYSVAPSEKRAPPRRTKNEYFDMNGPLPQLPKEHKVKPKFRVVQDVHNIAKKRGNANIATFAKEIHEEVRKLGYVKGSGREAYSAALKAAGGIVKDRHRRNAPLPSLPKQRFNILPA